MKNLIFLLLTITIFASCSGDEFYLLPDNPLDVPQDPMNNITAEKVELGKMLFSNTALSLTGTTSCASCHQEDSLFQSPDIRFVGGAGDGWRLDANGKYTAIPGFSAKMDTMTWVKSRAATNIAYLDRAGLSSRFGGTTDPQLRRDLIKHFALEDVPSKVIEKLFRCKATLFQAFVALIGHRQFAIERLLDQPDIVSSLESVFNTKITKDTDEYELMFMVACTLDAYQRTNIRNNTKFQKYLRGLEQLNASELLGKEILIGDCTSCHYTKVFSGGIAVSGFENKAGVPDCVNDITGVSIDTALVYRQVPAIIPGFKRYAPHGDVETIEDYLDLHFLHQGFEYTESEKKAIVDFINTL